MSSFGFRNGVNGFVEKHSKLLLLEFEEEKKMLTDRLSNLSGKECEEAGISITSLTIHSVRTALFGRSVLEINKIILQSTKYSRKLTESSKFNILSLELFL